MFLEVFEYTYLPDGMPRTIIEVECLKSPESIAIIQEVMTYEPDMALVNELRGVINEDNITTIQQKYDFSEVEYQANRTLFVSSERVTGWFIKEDYSISSGSIASYFSPFLPDKMCPTFLLTNLVLDMWNSPRSDFTEVIFN